MRRLNLFMLGWNALIAVIQDFGAGVMHLMFIARKTVSILVMFFTGNYGHILTKQFWLIETACAQLTFWLSGQRT